MGRCLHILNHTVAAILAVGVFSLPLQAADEGRISRMLLELQEAEPHVAQKLSKELELEWSKSGSAAMDLLLKRGRDALEAGDSQTALGHLNALTDHAPDFAEAWHLRAVALAQKGQYGPALEFLERSLALNPQNFNAMTSLGAILMELNRLDLARDAFERALAIYPHNEDLNQALDLLDSQSGNRKL